MEEERPLQMQTRRRKRKADAVSEHHMYKLLVSLLFVTHLYLPILSIRGFGVLNFWNFGANVFMLSETIRDCFL